MDQSLVQSPSAPLPAPSQSPSNLNSLIAKRGSIPRVIKAKISCRFAAGRASSVKSSGLQSRITAALIKNSSSDDQHMGSKGCVPTCGALHVSVHNDGCRGAAHAGGSSLPRVHMHTHTHTTISAWRHGCRRALFVGGSCCRPG